MAQFRSDDFVQSRFLFIRMAQSPVQIVQLRRPNGAQVTEERAPPAAHVNGNESDKSSFSYIIFRSNK